MINFRFHLASLIAIFLALALGVVVGAGVIDRGVVDTLNNRLDRVSSMVDRVQGENDVLRGENSELSDAISAMQCPAVANALVADDIASSRCGESTKREEHGRGGDAAPR
jgi:hypothetical protein